MYTFHVVLRVVLTILDMKMKINSHLQFLSLSNYNAMQHGFSTAARCSRNHERKVTNEPTSFRESSSNSTGNFTSGERNCNQQTFLSPLASPINAWKEASSRTRYVFSLEGGEGMSKRLRPRVNANIYATPFCPLCRPPNKNPSLQRAVQTQRLVPRLSRKIRSFETAKE